MLQQQNLQTMALSCSSADSFESNQDDVALASCTRPAAVGSCSRAHELMSHQCPSLVLMCDREYIFSSPDHLTQMVSVVSILALLTRTCSVSCSRSFIWQGAIVSLRSICTHKAGLCLSLCTSSSSFEHSSKRCKGRQVLGPPDLNSLVPEPY